MDAFINVIKKGPQIRIKVNDMLDRCNRLPYNYQSKIRSHSCLISSIISKKVIYLFYHWYSYNCK